MEAALSVLCVLQRFLPSNSIGQHARWAKKVCGAGLGEAIPVPLAKTALGLYLRLARAAEMELESFRALAQNFHAVLGDTDTAEENTPPQNWQQFALLTNKTKYPLVLPFLHALEEVFGELEWALSVAVVHDKAQELFEKIFTRTNHCAGGFFPSQLLHY